VKKARQKEKGKKSSKEKSNASYLKKFKKLVSIFLYFYWHILVVLRGSSL
jgi:hypothetical protein